MSSQRWPADKNIKFINEYEQYRCLWDPKHTQYKNKDARVAAYKEIMKTMEMETIKGVIAKIRSLRNTYNNESLKGKKCIKMASASKKLYISKIPWLSHLDFLKNIEGNARENTVNMTPNISKETSVTEFDSQYYASRTSIRNKKKTKDSLARAIGALEKVTNQHFTNDEFDLFGQTVAQQLRQLPLETALETEEMILSTIRKQRVMVGNIKQISQQDLSISVPKEQRVFERTSSSE